MVLFYVSIIPERTKAERFKEFQLSRWTHFPEVLRKSTVEDEKKLQAAMPADGTTTEPIQYEDGLPFRTYARRSGYKEYLVAYDCDGCGVVIGPPDMLPGRESLKYTCVKCGLYLGLTDVIA